jgi:hypothetical protein
MEQKGGGGQNGTMNANYLDRPFWNSCSILPITFHLRPFVVRALARLCKHDFAEGIDYKVAGS